MTTYDELASPSGYSIFEPRGIDDAGRVVGVVGLQGPAFVYSDGTYTPFNNPSGGRGAGQFTFPTAMSGDGKIAGLYVDSGGTTHPFIYIAGAYTTLPNPPGYSLFQPN